MARPSEFNEEIADKILDGLSSGLSLRRLCENKQFPDRTTVIRWQARYPEFAAKCAHAREMQADLMDDLILDTAQGISSKEGADIAKVQISAYMWRASKLQPKKYGDKIEHTGDGTAAFNVIVRSVLDEGAK